MRFLNKDQPLKNNGLRASIGRSIEQLGGPPQPKYNGLGRFADGGAFASQVASGQPAMALVPPGPPVAAAPGGDSGSVFSGISDYAKVFDNMGTMGKGGTDSSQQKKLRIPVTPQGM